MKTILLLLLTTTAISQSRFETAFLDNFYIAYGVDPAMLLNGPGHSYEQESTYHWHLEAGWEKDLTENSGVRIGVAFSDHDAIKYRKWTLAKVDYKLRNHFFFLKVKNLHQYAGAEVSTINRYDIPYRVNGRISQFTNDPTSFSAGVNVETQYQVGSFAIGFRYSYFLAEGELKRDGKHFRDEGTIYLVYKH